MKSARLDTPCTRQWTGQRSGREQRAGGGLGCVVCVLSGRVPDLSDELLLLLLALLLGLPAELLRSGVRGGRCGGGGSRSPQSLLRGVEPPARILHPNAPLTQPASSLSAILSQHTEQRMGGVTCLKYCCWAYPAPVAAPPPAPRFCPPQGLGNSDWEPQFGAWRSPPPGFGREPSAPTPLEPAGPPGQALACCGCRGGAAAAAAAPPAPPSPSANADKQPWLRQREPDRPGLVREGGERAGVCSRGAGRLRTVLVGRRELCRTSASAA